MGGNKALGRGLSALIEDMEESLIHTKQSHYNGNIVNFDINEIIANPEQPRKNFSENEIKELSESIKLHGVLQPILIQQFNGKYIIISGERRYRAAKLAGLTQIPAIIKNLSNKSILEVALIENIQRENLNIIEEAEAYKKLIIEYAYTQDDLSKIIHKSRSHITNTLRLLSLNEAIKEKIRIGEITMGHARALIGADDSEGLLEQVLNKKMSVRDTEKLVREQKTPKEIKPSKNPKSQDWVDLENSLIEKLGLKVVIEENKNSGKVSIYYDSLYDLDKIIKALSVTI